MCGCFVFSGPGSFHVFEISFRQLVQARPFRARVQKCNNKNLARKSQKARPCPGQVWVSAQGGNGGIVFVYRYSKLSVGICAFLSKTFTQTALSLLVSGFPQCSCTFRASSATCSSNGAGMAVCVRSSVCRPFAGNESFFPVFFPGTAFLPLLVPHIYECGRKFPSTQTRPPPPPPHPLFYSFISRTNNASIIYTRMNGERLWHGECNSGQRSRGWAGRCKAYSWWKALLVAVE